MQESTTGHNSSARAKCWHVYSNGVHAAIIALHTDVPHRADHPWGDACARLPLPNAQGHRAERQWAGLALIPFSHQLVRRLLIELLMSSSLVRTARTIQISKTAPMKPEIR